MYSGFKVIRNIILVTLFYLLTLATLNSQTYFFERYGAEQGLSFSKVYSIILDRNDRLWLGTEGGASNFNGTKFENFSAAKGMAPGGVMSMFMDTTGRIWFGHLNGGLTYFNGKTFIKTRFDSIRVTSDITSIKQLGEYIWATTSKDGAIRISLPEDDDSVLFVKQYLGIDGLGDQVSSSFINSKGELYCIATEAGILKRYNPEKDIFETFSPPGLTKFFNTIVMFEDSKGNYWYGTHNGGLYKFDKESETMKIYDIRDGLAHQMTTFITEDYRGNVWVGSWGGGITVFSGEEMKVYNRSNGLQATSIHCMIEDKEKNMIIADHNTGISIYKGDHFITYSDEAFLPDKNVMAIEEDAFGRYWFGTTSGISVYDPAKNKVQFYNRSKDGIGNEISFIESDHQGNIWIGTNGYGLFRFDLKNKKFNYDIQINNKLHSNGIITALALDGKNRLWIGNMDRLVVWDGESKEVSFFTQENGLAGSWISTVFCDKDNNLWIGSEEKPGLTKYNSRTGRFRIINIGESYVPRTITQTSDLKIWIGSTNGLLALKNDSVISILNENNGLLSNDIKMLQPEGENFLYIGTNFGLNRLNLTDSSLASFTRRNGFSGTISHANASINDSNGNLWFGTANGVIMLSPAKMPPIDTEPAVHINSMEVNYVPWEMREELALNYKDKSVVFNYNSVSFTNPDEVRYKVMLKGAETDWKQMENQTREDYPRLAPGRYTFKVIASNSYGYWSKIPVAYSFIVKPPFYLSPWFILTCIAALTLFIVSYIKIRERNLIREKKILEAKVAERTAEVVQKSMEIEEKNRDITSSIRYAERIQSAMLPPEDTFADTFVLYLPKDIVSGDFYWMYDNGDNQFIAAVDCTGHGVPGAFMSIIGYNSLNKVVKEYGITKPATILDQLNIEVIKALLQRDEKDIRDGMDLALINFNKSSFTLEYSGAYNSLYLVRNGEIERYRGDRFPIGMTSSYTQKKFSNYPINIQHGDMLYMCSDGYPDQIGFVTGKKFRSGNVKRVLSEIWHLPVQEQKIQLKKEITDWKGDLEQVDDILFIGFRIP